MNRSPYNQLWLSSPATQRLAKSSLFKPSGLSVSLEQQTRLTYRRAKSFCAVYGIQANFIYYTLCPPRKMLTEPSIDRGRYCEHHPKICKDEYRSPGHYGWIRVCFNCYSIQSFCWHSGPILPFPSGTSPVDSTGNELRSFVRFTIFNP